MQATDPAAPDPDRVAWALAEAAPGPDEIGVATELARSAGLRRRAAAGSLSAAAFPGPSPSR